MNDTPTAVIKLSASSVGKWLKCPAKVKFQEKMTGVSGGEVHIGSLIGNMVHALITGHKYKEPDNLVLFDSKTPTMSEAERQAERMAESVNGFIERNEIKIVDTEKPVYVSTTYNNVQVNLFGKIDLLCTKGDEVIIIDLKTGVNKPSSVFVQLGFYSYICYLSEQVEVDSVAVIWVRRTKDPSVELVQKVKASKVNAIASAAIKQIVLMQIANCYPYAPSLMTCSTCPHKKCPARVGDRIIEI